VPTIWAQTTPSTQVTYNLKSMMATSPEAAMLGRFGDVPIGYYTGTADISIPLYTIKEDGLEIPIVLSYHSSGFKVEDQATNVGLGWLLEPGGAVIQVVNGTSDQTDDFQTMPSDYNYLLANVSPIGFHSSRGSIGDAAGPCSPTPSYGDTENSMLGLLRGDLQPDIYQYNFPGGYSGKFYLNPSTHQPVLIDKQKQIFIQQGANSAWKITTLNGDRYYFNDEETSTDGGAASHQGYTFKLSQITLHNGKTINFSYANNTYNWTAGYSEFFHTSYPVPELQSTAEAQIQSTSSNENHYIKTITQIKTADVIINFNLGTRTDMQAPCIQSVDILDAVTGNKIKTFTFTYGYFGFSQVGSPNGGTDPLQGQRLKLTTVQETGYNQAGQAQSNPPYQFTYNESSPLPQKGSFAKDFWGYYNGVNNTNLLTSLKYPYYAGMLGTGFPYSYVTSLPGADRSVDTSKLSLGMLTQVIYPTGGVTKFSYESNAFTNYDYPDVNKENSRLVNLNVMDQNGPNDHNTVTFTTTRPLTFSINILFSVGYPTNNITYAQLAPSTVTVNKIENGTTTAIKTWQMSSYATAQSFTGNVQVPTDTVQIPYDPNATYQLVANLPNTIPDQTGNSTTNGNVSASISYYNVPNSGPYQSYGGGVRIASIKNYDNTGALLSNKSLKYINADGTCSGLLMSPMLLTYYRYMAFSDEFQTGAGPNMIWANGDVWYLSSESSIPFSTAAGGNLVGYSRVVETELNNSTATNGTHIYNYNNLPSETGPLTPDNPNLLNGKISQDQIYNNSGGLLLNTSYSYTSLSDTICTGFKNYYNLLTNVTSGCDGALYVPLHEWTYFNIFEYPIISHWYMLSNKTTIHYDGATPLTTNEYYAYNAMGQLAVDSTINSKNQRLTTHYIYPYDKYSSSPTAQMLVDSAFYENLLEQHLYNNGIETSEAKIGYKIIDGLLVRDSLNRSYNGNPLFNDVTFEHYGPNKTLKQVTERSAQPSAFLYDQNNSYLIADVKNAVLSDIAYSSFELNQPGNWTMSSTSGITQNLGFSGSQSFTLSSSNTLSKSGLTSTQSYIVSYWTNGTAPLTIAGTATGYPIKGVTLNGWTYYEHLVTGQTSVTLSGTGNIDEVRLYPQTAQMNTYTYNPLIGISSMVNAKNQINYYEYDGFQRLINIKDQYGNIIKHMSYHYQGQ